ncbi:MAG TPA: NAD-dependent epimerase/dehydratase family protein [Gammaproteobacteria bacterium]|nr:NAD-dependent epimerase/dehydratase family protein [Gammaproteobacteria bacterium]
MRILVTGSSGHLAAALLPRLCDEPGVEAVSGLDLRPARFSHPRFTALQADVRSARVREIMDGHDVLIHLAFVVMRGDLGRARHDRALMRDINVHGSHNVFQAAARAGVRRLVHLSSAAVYGAWPDNPERIDESRPLRPNPGFAYGEDKVAVEHALDALEAAYPQMQVVRLRPHAILGPNALPLLRFLLRQPSYPRLPEPQPLTQCVWEDDVATAVLQALDADATGAFNLAAEPALAFRDLQRYGHRWAVPVPFVVVRTLLRGLWPLTGAAGEPAWVEAMRWSLALDCRRARDRLAWQPRLSVYDCVDSIRSRSSP